MDGESEEAGPVYTVCDESRYLIVKNVPALGCVDELVNLFGQYGPIEEYRLMDEEECEPFTDIYWIKFVNNSNARFAKRKLDKYVFLGNLLKVNYAPKYETPFETKAKLDERKRAVMSRISSLRSKSSAAHLNRHVRNMDPLLKGLTSTNHMELAVQEKRKPIVAEQHVAVPSQHMKRGQYFNAPSMNVTVQSVRQKLDQIACVCELADPQCTHSKPYDILSKRQHAISDQMKEKHIGKKPRTDNRRRI